MTEFNYEKEFSMNGIICLVVVDHDQTLHSSYLVDRVFDSGEKADNYLIEQIKKYGQEYVDKAYWVILREVE